MSKKEFKPLEMEIVRIKSEDVIRTSPGGFEGGFGTFPKDTNTNQGGSGFDTTIIG